MPRQVRDNNAKTSLSFDGVDDYLYVETIDIQVKSGQARTIHLKFKSFALNQYLLSRHTGVGDGLRIVHKDTGVVDLVWEYSGGVASLTTSQKIPLNEWVDICYVVTDTSIAVYVNGALSNSATFATRTFNESAGIEIGRCYVESYGRMKVKKCDIFFLVLTAQEITDLTFNNIVPYANDPTKLVLNLEMNEGAGPTAFDTSGNDNHGTITGATWTDDIPDGARKLVDGNMVPNGDFSYAPPFVAVCTAQNKWIDGSAIGSSKDYTGKLFGWATNTNSASGQEVMYDNDSSFGNLKSLKVSTKEVNKNIEINCYLVDSDAGRKPFLIPVKPSTEYACTFKMKTNYVSGDAISGAYVSCREFDGVGAGITSTVSTKIKTTTNVTEYTVIFTTSANTKLVGCLPRLTCNDGAGTLIIDSWFADIYLRPTTPVTRALA